MRISSTKPHPASVPSNAIVDTTANSWDPEFVAKAIEMLREFSEGKEGLEIDESDEAAHVAYALEGYFYGQIVLSDEIRDFLDEEMDGHPKVRDLFRYLLKGAGIDLENRNHRGFRLHPVTNLYVLDVQGVRPEMVRSQHVDLTDEAEIAAANATSIAQYDAS